MKIDLTEKQYLSLLRLVYLGHFMAQSLDEEKQDPEIDGVAQEIYSKFKDFNAEDSVEYVAKQDEYFPSRPFEESMEPYVNAYDDRRFWEELEDKLAARDLVEKSGVEKAEKMPFEERFKLIESIAQQYEEEFVENGVRNLYLKKADCCSDPSHHHHHH